MWQPMPTPSSASSGLAVDVLCGQPEQKNGVRASIGRPLPGLRVRARIVSTRAATDSLTGTPNRRAFQDEARRLAAQASRSCEPLAAVLLDLDHFKDVNDTFGHAAGDLVLKFVGACLKGSVRAGDFVARLGGEEFALLLPGTGREGALVLAESVRQAIAQLDVPGVERGITASFGVAVIPDDAGSAEAVVHRADEALYAAKAAGRDCVVAASGGERQILPAG